MKRYGIDWQMQEEYEDPAGAWVKHEDAAVYISEATARIAELEQQSRQGRSDTERLNWLETRDVEVRKPLRYGSVAQFTASATQHDAESDHDSPLRARIDMFMRDVPSPYTESEEPKA